MSNVTSIIVTITYNETHNPTGIIELNNYISRNYEGEILDRLDKDFMQAGVWGGAIKYINLTEFLEVFKMAHWDNRGRIQLYIKGEHDDLFDMYMFYQGEPHNKLIKIDKYSLIKTKIC